MATIIIAVSTLTLATLLGRGHQLLRTAIAIGLLACFVFWGIGMWLFYHEAT